MDGGSGYLYISGSKVRTLYESRSRAFLVLNRATLSAKDPFAGVVSAEVEFVPPSDAPKMREAGFPASRRYVGENRAD